MAGRDQRRKKNAGWVMPVQEKKRAEEAVKSSLKAEELELVEEGGS